MRIVNTCVRTQHVLCVLIYVSPHNLEICDSEVVIILFKLNGLFFHMIDVFVNKVRVQLHFSFQEELVVIPH